jgi:hypothetical protein
MVESRWFRRAGPGIAAIGAMGLIASSVAGAPEASATDMAACTGSMPPRTDPGAWFRLDPVVRAGVLTGQRLEVGRLGRDRHDRLELDAESVAAGPFDGSVLLATDDGRFSRLARIDTAVPCRRDVAQESAVIRAATISPDRRSVVEARVDRVTRADLGIWRRSLEPGGPAPVRIVAPIDPDPRFGPTWLTDLAWSDDGRLVVGSCGAVACRFRVLDPSSGALRSVLDPRLGWLIGVAGGRLVSHAACRGLPCPIRATDLGSGATTEIAASAGAAVLVTASDGTPFVVAEASPDDRSLEVVDLAGRVVTRLAVGASNRLVVGPSWSGSAVEHAADQIALAPGGRMAAPGGAGVTFRRIPDGAAVPYEEAAR